MAQLHRSAPTPLSRSPSDASRPLHHSTPYDRPSDARPRRLPYYPAAAGPSDVLPRLRRSTPYDLPAVGSSSDGPSSNTTPRLLLSTLDYRSSIAPPCLHRSAPYDLPAVGSSSNGPSSNATPRLRLSTLDYRSSLAPPCLHRNTSYVLRRSTPYDSPSGGPSDPLRCKAYSAIGRGQNVISEETAQEQHANRTGESIELTNRGRKSEYTRDRDHADHPDHDDMKCETEIVDHSDTLKDVSRMIFFTLRSCTTVWAGIFDKFSFLGSETLKTSSENDWDIVLAHFPKYFKLTDTFYVLGAGLVSIIRTSLWVLATYISEHPGVKLTLDLLVRVIRTNESFKEMQGMAEREELLTRCDDFNATLLIVQLGVGVGEVSIDHQACILRVDRIGGAGCGYDDYAKEYLQDDVLPRCSTYNDVLAAAKNGFENAARCDYGSGGQGRFFGLYHDGRVLERDIVCLPTYNGPSGKFTPYHPSP